jgi:DNA mismatch repair protein MutL
MPIHILPDQLASQIAAGEVVERPASVVKELVENALDAGATTINIDVRGGGRQLVQVADNGSGIMAAEVELAFTRHATSKLHSVEELAAIGTLGFRGEALAAIAAMSQVTLVSRAQGETAGTRLMLEGGRKAGRETVGAPQGTVIAIENLFYNTPARLKFLKSVTTDKRHVDELVTRYALAYPGVRFRLAHDGRITFQSNGSGSFLDVIVAVYGPEIAGQLLEIGDSGLEIEDDDQGSQSKIQNPKSKTENLQSPISITGYIGPPSLHWGNRNHIVLFVNGRWIKDNSLTYAIVQAYHTLLPVGRFPLAIVFLSVPYEEVDVNVHPAKTEVRFREGNHIFGAVQRAVRQTLIVDSPVRNLGLQFARPVGPATTWSNSFGHEWGEETVGDEASIGRQASLDLDDPLDIGSSRPTPALEMGTASQSSLPLGGDRLPIMRVVGQVGASYIIAEGPEGLFLIDQHAAHERILYEQFMAERERNPQGVTSQGLVTGAAVHLAPSQATLLHDNLDLAGRLGFTIEPFGPNAFMVRAIPAIVAHLEPAVALLAVVEALERGDRPLQSEIEARLIRRVCKTAAIKAGQTLSLAEMETLIRQLEACQNPHTCPHGRPTLIHLSAAQLAREFGRT